MGKYCRSLVLVALCFAAVTSPCNGQCANSLGGENWYTLYTSSGYRYFYLRSITSGYLYDNAKVQCEDLGATLATSNNNQVNEFLINMMKQSGIKNAWIGLRDTKTTNPTSISARRDDWKWEDAGYTFNDNSYHNWTSGEPGSGERCTYLGRNYNQNPLPPFQWYGGSCATKAVNFICEAQEIPCSPSLACTTGCTICPGGNENWYKFNDRYYFIRMAPRSKSRIGAVTQCNLVNAKLAKSDSQGVTDFLKKLLVYTGTKNAWIGLSYTKSSNQNDNLQTRRADWEWADGSDVNYQSFHDWKSDHPLKGHRYGYMGRSYNSYYQATSDYQWLGYDTEYKYMNYICERTDLTCLCTPGYGDDSTWSQHNGRYYSFQTMHEKNFSMAKMECENMGSYLATSNSQSVNDFLVGMLSGDGITYSDAWIGLYNELGSGSTYYWKWAGGQAFDAGVYNNWTSTPSSSSQGCIQLKRQTEYWEVNHVYDWEKVTCTAASTYICERAQPRCVIHVEEYNAGGIFKVVSSSPTLLMSTSSIVFFTLPTLIVYSIQHGTVI